MFKYRALAFTNLHVEYYGTIGRDGILLGEFDTWEEADDAVREYAANRSNNVLWVHIEPVYVEN